MESLFESILASTGTGESYILKEKITKWADAYLRDYKHVKTDPVIHINKDKTVSVITNGTYPIINIDSKGLESMPTELSSLFGGRFENGIIKAYHTQLGLLELKNKKIDFSKWNITRDLKNLQSSISFYNILLKASKNVLIENLFIPATNDLAWGTMLFKSCENIELKNINAPKFSIGFDEKGLDISKIKNCKIQNVFLSDLSIPEFGCKKIFGNEKNSVFQINKKGSKAIDDLVRYNQIEKLIFNISGETEDSKEKEYYILAYHKLELEKDGDNYIFYKAKT